MHFDNVTVVCVTMKFIRKEKIFWRRTDRVHWKVTPLLSDTQYTSSVQNKIKVELSK